jgi:transketolase
VRDAFISELSVLAREDPRVFLVVGDLGFSVIEEFAAEFPDRFFNAGVAEQTMIGTAAGLAAAGYHVFVYSIGNFPTMRCIEQIRNDVCYHNRSVTVVAVGAGFSYGALGYTHHAIEDIAVMRALPRMVVLSPADPREARILTRQALSTGGPSYLRLGKNGEPNLHDSTLVGPLEPAIVVRPGTDITVLATGSIIELAIASHDELLAEGISLRVVSVPVVKPLDQLVLAAGEGTKAVITLEEHSLIGGLGSAVLELAAAERVRLPIYPMGIGEDQLGMHVGSQKYLREMNGLTTEAVSALVREVLNRTDPPARLHRP